MSITDVTIRPIGVVHSSYSSPYDAPRQPAADNRIDDAVIELYPHENYEQALSDLDGIERIWLVTWMHLVKSWKPMIQTPRDRTKRGVFATRSPHRPNPIGISVVSLTRVSGLKLFVSGTDLLNGTPVLDIKPYLPYADSYPDSRTGWIPPNLPGAFNVEWHVSNVDAELRAYAQRVLQFDPTPHPYRRIAVDPEGGYVLAYKWHRLRFEVLGTHVTVMSVETLPQ